MMKQMKRIVTVLALTLGVAGIAQASGSVTAGQAKAAVCAGCHGVDGNSPAAAFPKLAGQHEGYLAAQITDIRDGKRIVPSMGPFVATLTDTDIADLAAYFADQRIVTGKAKAELVELGQSIYKGGNPETGVPACAACHSPTGAGNAPAGFPALGGQHAGYIATQLKLFREGKRHTGELTDKVRTNDVNNMMRDIAFNMKDFEIDAVASYISGLSD
jgi:cytochrome c553